jgi:hypothetical protein
MKISIDNALKGGFKRMTKILFKPFDFTKWLILGFASFLASLGRGGGGFHFNMPSGNWGEDGSKEIDAFGQWFMAHLAAVIFVAVGLMIVGFAIFLIFNWLSSRGKFIFLSGIANNKAEISAPWVKYGHLGDRLFIFRLIFGLIIFFIILIFLLLGVFMLYPHFKAESFGLSFFVKIIFAAFFMVIIVLAVSVIKLILMDFVAPLMLKKDIKVLEGFSVFYNELLKGNFVSFLLFYLVKIGLSIAAGFLVLVATCLTCCIAAIPYISSVVFLPIAAFLESFTLSFLAEFGEDYNLFTWELEKREIIATEIKEEPKEKEPLSEDSDKNKEE